MLSRVVPATVADLLVMPTMLPAAPKSLGRLSDVFISALGAITGKNNRLGFNSVKSACVVLIDGLGSNNLRHAGGHAPFLNSLLTESKGINTVFPSTTAAAITSFGSAKKPGEHGVLGYSVFDREKNTVRNLLSGWSDEFAPKRFATSPSVADLARQSNVDCYVVGPADYEGSGFSELSMSGSTYVSATNHDEASQIVLSLLKKNSRTLVYWYFPELDQAAHAYGVDSDIWLERLELVDATFKKFNTLIPNDVGLLVTADHGIVDVPAEGQIMLDELNLPGIIAVTGDPRNTFIYFDDEANSQASIEILRDRLEGKVIVATAEEVIDKGWYPVDVEKTFMPDLFLLSEGKNACYHRAFAKPQSLRMIGQHGSISADELIVPLLKLGKFATRRS